MESEISESKFKVKELFENKSEGLEQCFIIDEKNAARNTFRNQIRFQTSFWNRFCKAGNRQYVITGSAVRFFQ